MRILLPLLLPFCLPLAVLAKSDARGEPWSPASGKPQYFAVSVADLDASMAWYSTALGLRKLDEQSAADGSWRIVNLVSDDFWVELIHDRRDGTSPPSRGFAKVGWFVPDVRVVAERAGRAAGRPPRVIEVARQNLRILQLRDPDGNVLQLMSPLGD